MILCEKNEYKKYTSQTYSWRIQSSAVVFLFYFFIFIYLFFKDFVYFFSKREEEKHQCVVASHMPPTGDLARNPGMCPDWESNWRPFGSQAGTHSTEPHSQSSIFILKMNRSLAKGMEHLWKFQESAKLKLYLCLLYITFRNYSPAPCPVIDHLRVLTTSRIQTNSSQKDVARKGLLVPDGKF